ncbi:MAG: CHASE2 domain-containing protein [candidate division KSB1 bacterium]|nr:CHASE2 domain-containing protein [candidate division KSB1 bacterium]MDZ7274762.1 CHASE2 domain-containing protein [candidate division KSB1 bacterium]MDZ7285587.1 CHASE2 domain-containing protein [candidate division KSB1 bacterium]MDZ7298619.1 CHASE2 domain-containing protein [candidate division KSB1 bacterium]MDZ7307628.1 CHASE2 domain-containing protein [candidate division KSB1 bacterium]
MMLHTFRKICAHPVFALSVIVMCYSALALFPLSWREKAEEAVVDLQFRLRGNRPLSDKIVLVYLGAEELQALGGWPLTRDYYGHLLHGLHRARAQVVGLDLLFDRAERHHPDRDSLLAGFLRSAGNVCLPLAFAELTPADSTTPVRPGLPPRLARGHAPLLPLPAFRQNAAALGFSNLDDDAVIRKTPLVLRHDDTLRYAFGFELARLYLGIAPDSVQTTARTLRLAGAKPARREIPLDHQGRLRLNHFGSVDEVTAWSFVELLRRFNRAPDSLDFSGKIVLLTATAPGLSVLTATPLSESLPAALIHATIAENIIAQNFLRESPMLLRVVMITLLVLAASWIGRSRHAATVLVLSVAVLGILALRAIILFRTANLVVPVLLPALAYLTALAFLRVRRQQAH